MIEVIQTDFARLETDTKSAEATQQESYDKLNQESTINKASMEQEITHKTEKKTSDEGELTRTKEDLVGTQEELDAALAFYDKLKPTCVDAGVSYEDRVAR